MDGNEGDYTTTFDGEFLPEDESEVAYTIEFVV